MLSEGLGRYGDGKFFEWFVAEFSKDGERFVKFDMVVKGAILTDQLEFLMAYEIIRMERNVATFEGYQYRNLKMVDANIKGSPTIKSYESLHNHYLIGMWIGEASGRNNRIQKHLVEKGRLFSGPAIFTGAMKAIAMEKNPSNIKSIICYLNGLCDSVYHGRYLSYFDNTKQLVDIAIERGCVPLLESFYSEKRLKTASNGRSLIPRGQASNAPKCSPLGVIELLEDILCSDPHNEESKSNLTRSLRFLHSKGVAITSSEELVHFLITERNHTDCQSIFQNKFSNLIDLLTNHRDMNPQLYSLHKHRLPQDFADFELWTAIVLDLLLPLKPRGKRYRNEIFSFTALRCISWINSYPQYKSLGPLLKFYGALVSRGRDPPRELFGKLLRRGFFDNPKFDFDPLVDFLVDKDCYHPTREFIERFPEA